MARRRSFGSGYSAGQRRAHYLSRKLVAAGAVVLVVLALAMADRWGIFGRGGEGDDWARYNQQSFRVARVVDGDTIDLDVPDGQHAHTRVRLLGVDTPETVKPNTPVQHWGKEASAYTRQVALGRTVRVELDRARTRDKYNRLLAYIILPDGANLCLRLVETGNGYADPRFGHPLKSKFAHAQTEARKAQLGLWKDLKEEDLPDYLRGTIKLPGRASAGGAGARGEMRIACGWVNAPADEGNEGNAVLFLAPAARGHYNTRCANWELPRKAIHG